MNKRKLLITGVGLAILLISVVASRYLKRDEPARNTGAVNIATAVNTRTIAPGEVVRTVKITGRLVPKSTVNIFAEVGGIAQFGAKPFKPGVRFNAGDVLIKINSEEIESSLAAARSGFQSLLAGSLPDIKLDFPNALPAWEAYLYEMRLDRRLPELPEIKDQKLRLFMSGRNILTSYYNIREAETRLDKHIITAPFGGTLTETSIDAASLVRTGQPLGTFISTGAYELEAGVSYADIESIKPGTRISMRDVNTGATYEARVVRINDAVNPETQQVKIFAEVNDQKARSGIYLEGHVPVATYSDAVEIPIQAIVNEAAVFAIRDSIATLLPVNLIHKDADKAIATGIKQQEVLITDKHNEAFAGSKVSIVNLVP
jgi:multidrug efflux pump subunit AcrA (membrane-fusion protein)